MSHPDDLSREQELWLLHQTLLDQGLRCCPQCEEVGSDPFCTHCGTRRDTDPGVLRTCTRCQTRSATPYCGTCGAALLNSVVEQLETGTFDWAKWERDLQPFMGGLTAAEEAHMLTLDHPNGHR